MAATPEQKQALLSRLSQLQQQREQSLQKAVTNEINYDGATDRIKRLINLDQTANAAATSVQVQQPALKNVENALQDYRSATEQYAYVGVQYAALTGEIPADLKESFGPAITKQLELLLISNPQQFEAVARNALINTARSQTNFIRQNFDTIDFGDEVLTPLTSPGDLTYQISANGQANIQTLQQNAGEQFEAQLQAEATRLIPIYANSTSPPPVSLPSTSTAPQPRVQNSSPQPQVDISGRDIAIATGVAVAGSAALAFLRNNGNVVDQPIVAAAPQPLVTSTQPQEVDDIGIGGDTGLLPSEAELQREAAPQADAYIGAGDTGGVPTQSLRQIGGDTGLTPDEIAQQQAATRQQATLDRARAQATLQQQRKQANDGDWRVKLRLAPGAQYLYRAAQPGILQPLAVTDGVVFPYTPQITTAYKATYNSYNLTHSNYRGFFYQGSQVDDIQITGKFTAQDSNEANYLLAVIHFFRSITKMFYGNDPQRGAPPPLVFLQGLGEYQFNLAPCVVAQFNYTLPDSVDYIRAGSPNINGTNLLQRRTRQDLPTNSFSSAWSRIQNVLGAQGIRKGAIPAPPAPPTLGTNRPTYVPTAMEISIVLHPIQSRSQVSKQFSLQQYANGDLLKGGFW